MKQLINRGLSLFLAVVMAFAPIAHAAQQTINRGTTAGDGTGETLYSAFGKVNANDAELYSSLATKAPLASPTFTGTVSGITKAMVGLGNVDNTADANKPVSTAQQTAIDAAKPVFAASFGALPGTGDSAKIYITTDTGMQYRWDGTAYALIGKGFGSNVITVGAGGQYASIQAAIDSITDNLPVSYNVGTVAVTNGSATITFSSSPAADKVVAGRDLFTVDGVRYYRIKAGPSATGGAVFTLLEPYQGATNAAASFSIVKPNPRTIVLLPGVYDYTSVALARNVMLKPYVGITGIDRDATIIRRNKNNSTSETTPVVGLAHGSWLRNVTIDATDGHFMLYRMGLTARATTQTQAMRGSSWVLDNVAILNKDPNGIDSGADYDIDNSFYNDDQLLISNGYFEHCWDGFTWNTKGGRLAVTFKNPVIYKTPLPQGLYASGAAFIRAGVTGDSTTDVLIVNPVYDQKTLSAGEVVNDGAGGFVARTFGFYGFMFVGGGATGKIVNPSIDMDVGSNIGRSAGFGLASGNAGTSSLLVVGGYVNIAGAGGANAADYVDGGFNDLDGATLTICGTRIEAGENGIRQNSATATTNLQCGARIKGTANSLKNAAGVMNKSGNVSAVGATSGTITSAEN